jgi:hypothetical protein
MHRDNLVDGTRNALRHVCVLGRSIHVRAVVSQFRS